MVEAEMFLKEKSSMELGKKTATLTYESYQDRTTTSAWNNFLITQKIKNFGIYEISKIATWISNRIVCFGNIWHNDTGKYPR